MLTAKEKERYERQILLDDMGAAGQEKLLSSRVLIIGAGGLGSPSSLYLAALGVGTIGLADGDKVELSNLPRQIIHMEKNIGKAKVLSAKELLQEQNPDVEIKIYNEFINKNNLADIIEDYDFVIDAVDNFTAKFLINDICVQKKKAYVHAGVLAYKGQLMTYVPGRGPCYRCLFGDVPPDTVPTCKTAGILSPVAGIIGTLEAVEAVKYITGIGSLLTGRLLTYNAATAKFRTINVPRDEKCMSCGLNKGE